jgi:hypothetical protein
MARGNSARWLAYDRHRHCGQGHCAGTGIYASEYDDGVQRAAMDVEKIDALHSRGLRLSADLSRVGEEGPTEVGSTTMGTRSLRPRSP